jgi:hypothetical protein
MTQLIYRIVFEGIFRGSDFKFQTLDTTLRIELESYREIDVRQCFSWKFSSAWLMRYCNTKRKFDSAPGLQKNGLIVSKRLFTRVNETFRIVKYNTNLLMPNHGDRSSDFRRCRVENGAGLSLKVDMVCMAIIHFNLNH